MRLFLLAIILLCPRARAFGQTDSLSDCQKKYLEWNEARERFKDFIDGERLPIPVKNDPAVYPDSARNAGIEGSVWVWCIVDTNGVPKCIRVVKGIGHGCDEAAVEAMKQWRFTPVVSGDGRKLEMPTTMPFKFKLSMKKEA